MHFNVFIRIEVTAHVVGAHEAGADEVSAREVGPTVDWVHDMTPVYSAPDLRFCPCPPYTTRVR